MRKYTVYCTEEQTRRAYKLGAPMNDRWAYHNKEVFEREIDIEYRHYIEIPTTQQMTGWIREEKHINIVICNIGSCFGYGMRKFENNLEDFIGSSECDMTHEQAELAAIDVALDYLERNASVH